MNMINQQLQKPPNEENKEFNRLDSDFERANTDVEDNDTESYYYEEEVTDDEAMK